MLRRTNGFARTILSSQVQALPGQAETGRTTFVHLECIRIGEDVKPQKEHVCLKQIAKILKDSSWKWLAPSAMCYPDLAQDSSRGAQWGTHAPEAHGHCHSLRCQVLIYEKHPKAKCFDSACRSVALWARGVPEGSPCAEFGTNASGTTSSCSGTGRCLRER